MYTEDDLRAVFGAVEREAPDMAGTLAGLDRLRRRRTLHRTALGMVAAVATTVAVAATALVVGNLAEDNATPAAQPTTPLRLSFAVDPVPGHQVFSMARDATQQRVTLSSNGNTVPQYFVTVFSPGTFDPAGAQTGEPVDVNGRPGYFSTDLPCPCDGDTPRPTIAWEYADNAWANAVDTRPLETPASDARANLSRIAAAVRFDRTTRLLIPFRVGYLPAGLRPRSANIFPSANRSVQLGWPAAGDVAIETTPTKGTLPPVGQPWVGASPGTVPERLGAPRERAGGVNVGQFAVRLIATGLTDAELVRILRSVTQAADFDDPSTWFDAEEAIPGG